MLSEHQLITLGNFKEMADTLGGVGAGGLGAGEVERNIEVRRDV